VLLQGFFRGILSAGVVHVSTGIGDVSAGFGDACATDIFRIRCIQEVWSCIEPPSLGPFEAIEVSSSSCFKRALVVPPRDGG
jgi:hypothetical protein